MTLHPMIRSMTGYAEASAEVAGVRLTVELRTVNHRYADVRLRLPSELGSHEGAIRRKVLDCVRRGRVDLSVGVGASDAGRGHPQLNRALLEEAMRALSVIREDWGISGDPGVGALLGMPGMFSTAAVGLAWTEPQRTVLDQTIAAALLQLEQERRREGAHLQQEMFERLDSMVKLTAAMRARAAELPTRQRDRLIERLRALTQDVQLDPASVAREAAILADRSDITEELVRLDGHLAQARSLLSAPDGEPVGKRLEFLLQEIGRETNTINSKASDLALGREALALKAEVEKVREQVQNLE